jgi:hypothetical protein
MIAVHGGADARYEIRAIRRSRRLGQAARIARYPLRERGTDIARAALKWRNNDRGALFAR